MIVFYLHTKLQFGLNSGWLMQNNKNVTVELIFIRVIPRIDCYVLCCSHSLTLCVVWWLCLCCSCVSAVWTHCDLQFFHTLAWPGFKGLWALSAVTGNMSHQWALDWSWIHVWPTITEIKRLPAVCAVAVSPKRPNHVFARLSSRGAYVCKGRWLMPLGEALWENADLQLCIPMKFKRAPPLPPPPGPAMCTLLLDMLASNPDSRPPANQLEARVRSALKEDSHWHKVVLTDHNGCNHYSHYMEILTAAPLTAVYPTCVSNSHFAATGGSGDKKYVWLRGIAAGAISVTETAARFINCGENHIKGAYVK